MSAPLKLERLSRQQVEQLVVLHSGHVKSLQTLNNMLLSELYALTDVPDQIKATVVKWNTMANGLNDDVEEIRFRMLAGPMQNLSVN